MRSKPTISQTGSADNLTIYNTMNDQTPLPFDMAGRVTPYTIKKRFLTVDLIRETSNNAHYSVDGPETALVIIRAVLAQLDTDKEHFLILALDTGNHVFGFKVISTGNLNSSIVHPREVFQVAMLWGAAAIIGAHNHPSGNVTPSREDRAVTLQLKDAGRILGIPFHDHLIVAPNSVEFTSMAHQGLC